MLVWPTPDNQEKVYGVLKQLVELLLFRNIIYILILKMWPFIQKQFAITYIDLNTYQTAYHTVTDHTVTVYHSTTTLRTVLSYIRASKLNLSQFVAVILRWNNLLIIFKTIYTIVHTAYLYFQQSVDSLVSSHWSNMWQFESINNKRHVL